MDAVEKSVENRNLSRAEWKAYCRQQRLTRDGAAGMGFGAHQIVDRVAAEIKGAVEQAGRILAKGGTRGTYWGRRHQDVLRFGDEMPLHVIEGNARQQIAYKLLRDNEYMRSASVIRNHGHQLDLRNSRGNLYRPDYQLPLDST